MESWGWTDASTRMLTNDSDSANQTHFSCYHPLVVEYRYFAVLWGCLVTITGTVGNLMTVLAFASDPCIRTRFNVLIVNLALADLLYCALLQPVSTDSYLHLRWRGGALGCRVFGLLLFVSNAVSILTLCLIAVSRYLLVQRRATFERLFSARGLLLLLPSTWALALACFGPLWPVYVFVPQVCTCSFHRTRGRPYTTIMLFLYFFAGLFCVGVFYLLIYRRVRLAARALLRYRPSRQSSGGKVAPAAGTEEEDSGVSSGGAPTCTSEVGGQGEHGAGAAWYKESGEPQPTRSALDSRAAGASPQEPASTTPSATPPPATPPSAKTPSAKTPPSTSSGPGRPGVEASDPDVFRRLPVLRVLLRPVPAAQPGRPEGPRPAGPPHVLRQPDLAQQLHQPAALRRDEPPVPTVLPSAAHQGLLTPGPSLETWEPALRNRTLSCWSSWSLWTRLHEEP